MPLWSAPSSPARVGFPGVSMESILFPPEAAASSRGGPGSGRGPRAGWSPMKTRLPSCRTVRAPAAGVPALLLSFLFAAILPPLTGAKEPEGPGRVSAAPAISEDPGFFPIAVWLQDPRNAVRYREAGINLYVALWKGPTEEQLAAL